MRASNMVIGEEYALSGRRELVRVTMLVTDPDVCGRGWVRVRFEEGILAGEVKRVSSQRIFAPWEQREAPAARRAPKRRPAVIRGPWPPEPGEPIFWHRTGEVRWLVEEVDRRNRRATITTELVGRKQTHTVSWVELQPFETEVEPDAASEPDRGGLLPHLELVAPDPEAATPTRERERLSDLEVAQGLQTIIGRLVFAPEALERYRRRFAKRETPQAASKMLERELRRRGKPFRQHPGEYLRVRVEGRFDVLLRKRPEEESVIYIGEDDLRIVGARRKLRGAVRSTENPDKRAA